MTNDAQAAPAAWRTVRPCHVKEGDYVRFKDIHGVTVEGRVSTKRKLRHEGSGREFRVLSPGQSFPTLYLVDADVEVREFHPINRDEKQAKPNFTSSDGFEAYI